MPYCPRCHYEYMDEVKKCPDCSVKLVKELPEEKHMDEDMVTVFTAKDEVEGDIVTAILKEAGVPVWQKADAIDWPGPFTVGPLAEEEIAVPVSRVDEAQQIIENALEDGKQLPVEE